MSICKIADSDCVAKHGLVRRIRARKFPRPLLCVYTGDSGADRDRWSYDLLALASRLLSSESSLPALASSLPALTLSLPALESCTVMMLVL